MAQLQLTDEVAAAFKVVRGKRVSQRFYSGSLQREVVLAREKLPTVEKLVAAGEIALVRKKPDTEK